MSPPGGQVFGEDRRPEVFVAMQAGASVEGRARIARDGLSVADECLRTVPNPTDLVALEAALGLREAGQISTVTCIAIGASTADTILSHGMAMGADRVVRIPMSDQLYLDARFAGRAIAAAVAGSAERLVFTGGESVDGEAEALSHMIAVALGATCMTNVASFSFSDTGMEVERRLERGRRERWRARLPAVVAFAPRANDPRYVAVAALCLARRTTSPEVISTEPQLLTEQAVAATALRKFVAPRIRPKRRAGRASAGTVGERMRAAVDGGVGETKNSDLLSGPPARVADRIVAFLDERGFLGTGRE